jgi:hypothetical protein
MDDVNLIGNATAPECASSPSPADGATDVAITDIGELLLSWTPASTGDPATSFEVSIGTSPGVYSNTFNSSTPSFEVFGLNRSTTYYWTVVPSNVGGSAVGCPEWSFTTQDPAPPPSNDDFANAIALNCNDTVTGDTSQATLDEDDAPDAPNATLNAPNVWYSYTGAGVAEDITLDLCQSQYDTSVLVYTGTSGNLTLVAANDDSADCNATQSKLIFPSDGTTTYFITITGSNPSSTGTYNMTVSCEAQATPPPNDECANAEALTVGVQASGTTVGATVDPGDDNPSCEGPSASIVDVWYTIDITGGTSDLTITTTITGTSDQANVSVYTDCSLAQELRCSRGNGGESLTINGLEVGTYVIRVFGDGLPARTEGTFNIVADVTLSNGDIDNKGAFSYYPNPTQGIVQFESTNTIERITAINMLGQTVLSLQPNQLNPEVDLSALKAGTYFLQVEIGDVTETVRVIKE